MGMVQHVNECPTDYLKCVAGTQHISWDKNDNIACEPLGETIALRGCVQLPISDKDPIPCFVENDPCPCGCSGSDGGGGAGEGVTAETVTTMIQEQTPAIVNDCMNDFASGQITEKSG